MSSVQSVVGRPDVVPRLLYSSSNARDLVFVDFVGLGCKFRRSRRKLGVSSTTPSARGLLGRNNWSSSSIRAVLDLERTGTSSSKVPSHSDDDSKPKVCF